MVESEPEYGKFISTELSYISKLKNAFGFTQHKDIVNKTLTSEGSSSFNPSTKNKVDKNTTSVSAVKTDAPKTDYNRVVVYSRKDSLSLFTPANFSVCLFDYFDVDPKQYVCVECFIENGKVFVQPKELQRKSHEDGLRRVKKDAYRLEHPVFCAVHRLSEDKKKTLPQEIAERGMDVGVSVLVESSDGKLLMTRRAYHMRTFPGVWVPPGGHIEEGEDFEKAGLREVKEETGLELSENINCRVLGLWESVFPSVLYEGDPRRHHLVIYLSVILKQSSEELQNLIKLDPGEVDASMWISQGLVSIAIEGGGAGSHTLKMVIPITMVNSDGSHTTGYLNSKVLRKKMPAPGRIVERFTTGTRYAMKLWLREKKRTRSDL